MIKEPRFWGSWKGRVISAIVLHDVHDWKGIQYFSELSSDILLKVLKEMFDLDILKKPYVDTYWLTDDIYNAYRNYSTLALPLEKETSWSSTLSASLKEPSLALAIAKNTSLSTFTFLQ